MALKMEANVGEFLRRQMVGGAAFPHFFDSLRAGLGSIGEVLPVYFAPRMFYWAGVGRT